MGWLLSVAFVLVAVLLLRAVQATAPPPRPRIVCFGNSLTACGGLDGRYSDYLAAARPQYEFVNMGMNGDTLAGGRQRFQRDALEMHPLALILELGANDFHQNARSVAELREDLEFMVRTARQQGIRVVIAGVFGPQLDADGRWLPKVYPEGDPARGQRLLEAERAMAAAHGCGHVENIQADLNRPEHWGDPRHPSAAGNALVARRLLPVLEHVLSGKS